MHIPRISALDLLSLTCQWIIRTCVFVTIDANDGVDVLGWVTNGLQQLSGVTHTSNTTTVGRVCLTSTSISRLFLTIMSIY